MGEAGARARARRARACAARGAKIYAEVAGYGISSDAKHVTEPDPTGENPARAMRMAFDDAGIDPGEIDYINAHGTSTPLGDAAETRVIKLALGEENARKTPVSSTKGATGHCLGAAGALEAIFSTLAIRDGKLPPTINYEVADPECDLDYIPNETRDADVRVAVSNSFGFGGHNASIVLKPRRRLGSSPYGQRALGDVRLLRHADRLERRHPRASSRASSARNAPTRSSSATTSSSRAAGRTGGEATGR